MQALHRGSLEEESPYQLGLVVSNNSQSGAARYAHENDIPFHHVSTVTHPDDDARDRALTAVMDQQGINLVVTAGYMKKLGPRTLDRFVVINVHPALLPDFGGQGMWGRHVHEAVLAAGAPVTGATVHYVTAGYDEGPIIASTEVPVLANDTIDSLAERVLAAEHDLLPRVVADLAMRSR